MPSGILVGTMNVKNIKYKIMWDNLKPKKNHCCGRGRATRMHRTKTRV